MSSASIQSASQRVPSKPRTRVRTRVRTTVPGGQPSGQPGGLLGAVPRAAPIFNQTVTPMTGPPRTSLLRSLGLVGMDAIEPVVIASLATANPLLLIGPHGTAKSLLLCRLCEALDVSW